MKRIESYKFTKYDTPLLQKALEILQNVYRATRNSWRRSKLLETVVSKLEQVIEEYGDTTDEK